MAEKRAYFFYERVLGEWYPVVVYGDNLEKHKSKYYQHTITTPVALQPEDFDLDEATSFVYLTRKYPAPLEKKMVRPVEGFMSKDGKFFNDKNECTIHEVVYALNFKLFDKLKQLEVTEAVSTMLLDNFMEFTYENKVDFERYFQARFELEAGPSDEEHDSASQGTGTVQ